MSVTSKIPNVVFLGLLVSLCLLSDRGFGTAETIVDTDPHVLLEVGTRGILPCRIQTKAYSVEWKRQLSSETELLVSLDTYVYVGARKGPGYEAGLFNITDDYSLVIKDVKVQDEGLYICSVSDFKSGKFFRNSTRVSVQAFPDEPFPVIQECIGKDVHSGSCTLTIHQTYILTCLVRGYYPDIGLFFLHGTEKVRSIGYEEWNNADMTKNREIRVHISVSDEPYECVVSGLPGIARNRSVSVIVLQVRPEARSQGSHPAVIAITVLLIVLACLSIAKILKHLLGKGRGCGGASSGNNAVDGYMMLDSERKIPLAEYYYRSFTLDLKTSEAEEILRKHKGDTTEAFRECGAIWKDRTGGSWIQLREILRNAEKAGSGGASSEHMDPAYRDIISDSVLNILSCHVQPCEYYQLCYSLNMGLITSDCLLLKNNFDYTKASRECLNWWKDRTGGSMAELKEVLYSAELAGLVEYLK